MRGPPPQQMNPELCYDHTAYSQVCILTWDAVQIWIFVAVVLHAACGVHARVLFDRRGAEKGPVSWYQLSRMYTLAPLDGHLAARLPDGHVADAIRGAAGVGAAAVAVTLESCRRKRRTDTLAVKNFSTSFIQTYDLSQA